MTARQSYLQLLVERLVDDSTGFNFGFSDTQGKIVFDFSPTQRAEFTVIAGRSKLEENRNDLDSQDLFTGRNASAMAIGTWRLTRPRGVLTTRVLTSYNQFSNETTEQLPLDKGHDKEAAGRVDATRRLRRMCSPTRAHRRSSSMRRAFASGSAARWDGIAPSTTHGRATVRAGYAQVRFTAGPLTIIPGAQKPITGRSPTKRPLLRGCRERAALAVDDHSRRHR